MPDKPNDVLRRLAPLPAQNYRTQCMQLLAICQQSLVDASEAEAGGEELAVGLSLSHAHHVAHQLTLATTQLIAATELEHPSRARAYPRPKLYEVARLQLPEPTLD